jgi:hypothetical protein
MALSFNYLGNIGRLGNQMFQYAALKGVCSNLGFEFMIPPKSSFGTHDQDVKKSDCNIYDFFDLDKKNTIGTSKNIMVKEKFFHFDEDLFNNCSDNVDLFGYFQSPKYFEKIQNEIRKDFTFPQELKNKCDEFFNSSFDSEVISLHIRRGDYLSYSHHPVQSLEYYESALSILPSDLPVIIFSDDISWCESQPIFSSDRFFISENNTTEFDLCLMSLCKYHIIANSSFSWWGSWLSSSKKTIAPHKWFGGHLDNSNLKDLYMKEWIVL